VVRNNLNGKWRRPKLEGMKADLSVVIKGDLFVL
jgi:hypothetical protein